MIDSRDILFVDRTFDSVSLIEQHAKLQNTFNTLLIALAVVGCAALVIGVYIQDQKVKERIYLA